MLIYILEDDEQILEMMTYALQSSDYEVAGFQSAFALYQQLSQRLPSLILLDLMLPDEDGLTVLKKLRSDPIYQDLRIIIVSAKSSELDKVRGLDLGADDYLTKPFGIMELISRVKAQLRRVPGSASLSPLLSCGSLDPESGHPRSILRPGANNAHLQGIRAAGTADAAPRAGTFTQYHYGSGVGV